MLRGASVCPSLSVCLCVCLSLSVSQFAPKWRRPSGGGRWMPVGPVCRVAELSRASELAGRQVSENHYSAELCLGRQQTDKQIHTYMHTQTWWACSTLLLVCRRVQSSLQVWMEQNRWLANRLAGLCAPCQKGPTTTGPVWGRLAAMRIVPQEQFTIQSSCPELCW